MAKKVNALESLATLAAACPNRHYQAQGNKAHEAITALFHNCNERIIFLRVMALDERLDEATRHACKCHAEALEQAIVEAGADSIIPGLV
jgi:hypothetical protein